MKDRIICECGYETLSEIDYQNHKKNDHESYIKPKVYPSVKSVFDNV